MTTFSEILSAADQLPIDAQQTLVEILQRRIAERGRAEIVRDVADARAEFAAGKAQPASAKDIMDEVTGEA
jgi:hypothetical protein